MVTCAVVVMVAAVIGTGAEAWATGLTQYTADGSGNYAECNVTEHYLPPTDGSYSTDYPNASSTLTSNGWNGTGIAATYDGLQYSINCNTADQPWAGSAPGMRFYPGSGGYASLDSYDDPSGWNTSTTWPSGSGSFSYTNVGNPDGHGGDFACFDPAVEATSGFASLSSGNQNAIRHEECGYGTAECSITMPPYYSDSSCGVVVAVVTSVSTYSAGPPGVAWDTEAVGLPAPPPPVPVCTVSLDGSTIEATATNTVVTGTTPTYDWDWGDSTSHGTAATGTHTYSGPGAYDVTLTETATGDGATYTGSTSMGTATCHVDTVAGSTGVGGTASTGAPISCGWTDLLCEIKAAVAWLVVPTSTFFDSWQGFLSALEGHVPFSYVSQASSWLSGFVGAAAAEDGSVPSCPSIGDLGQPGDPTTTYCGNGTSGGGSLNTWAGDFRDGVGMVVILGTIAAVWTEARRVLGQH